MADPTRFWLGSLLEICIAYQLTCLHRDLGLHSAELVLHGSCIVGKSQGKVANSGALLLFDLFVQIFPLGGCCSIYVLFYKCFHFAVLKLLFLGEEGKRYRNQFVELLIHSIVGCLSRLLLQVLHSFFLLRFQSPVSARDT